MATALDRCIVARQTKRTYGTSNALEPRLDDRFLSAVLRFDTLLPAKTSQIALGADR